MPAYEYEVTQDIAEIGARVWDVLVWDWPDVYLYRIDCDGNEESYLYPSHFTFLFLKYQDHLQPLSADCPAPLELARVACGNKPWGGPGRRDRPFRVLS